MKIEFDFCCSLCCIKFDNVISSSVPVKNQSENIKLSNIKKKKKSLPTYPPAVSVGRQCQTNNILRVA